MFLNEPVLGLILEIDGRISKITGRSFSGFLVDHRKNGRKPSSADFLARILLIVNSALSILIRGVRRAT